MWESPKAVSLVAGHGEGGTELNAFDRALMDAGAADLNFLRVTSILPPGARVIELPAYPPGLLMPAVYARIVSTRAGDRISAAIGVGISRDSLGVIMEYTGHTSRAEAEHLMATGQRHVNPFYVTGTTLKVQRGGAAGKL